MKQEISSIKFPILRFIFSLIICTLVEGELEYLFFIFQDMYLKVENWKSTWFGDPPFVMKLTITILRFVGFCSELWGFTWPKRIFEKNEGSPLHKLWNHFEGCCRLVLCKGSYSFRNSSINPFFFSNSGFLVRFYGLFAVKFLDVQRIPGLSKIA